MKKEALWTVIRLIVLIGILAVMQGLLGLGSTAERWEFLMRQLRR